MKVLSVAVSRRGPIFFCPVTDFTSLAGLPRPAAASAAGGGYAGSPSAAKLVTMLMLRPLSTAEEAFAALKHEEMLRGDLVRVEAISTDQGSSGNVSVLRRDDTLRCNASTHQALVLRIMTNKKAK
eukprot:TRINITY_DN8019_c0_g2_i1.p1 TRINITY_DN8019_c0_g2~~TRINITY_DN8019_c0_g2_i1.p1  ORF type:complete len:126 (-),score=27.98 TRINITY_DN8019_c0_g2_i1:314-691(-)